MLKKALFFSILSLTLFTFLPASAESPLPLSITGTSVTPADFEPIKNPKMKWAKGTFAKDPSVIRFQNRYFLYYSIIVNHEGKGLLTIGIATSSNLTDWQFEKNIFPMQEVDRNGLGAPCAKVVDGRVLLFYQTYGNNAKDAICFAWSDDGLNFTPHPQNPVFRPHGGWTNGRAIDAEVAFFKGKVFLYAATRDPEGKIQKLTAASADPKSGFGPGAWTQAADFSILEPELPWEKSCIEAPTTMIHGDKIYLFYAGGYNNDPQQIGVAVSSDGVHFSRLWNVPFIPNGPEGQWNSSESGHPGLFTDDDGTVWLFYQGNATHGKDWYLSRVRLGWNENGEIPTPLALPDPE